MALLYDAPVFFEGGREKNLAAILQIPGSGQPAPQKTKRKKGFASKAAGDPGKPRPNPGEQIGIVQRFRKKRDSARSLCNIYKRSDSKKCTARRRESRNRAARSNKRANMGGHLGPNVRIYHNFGLAGAPRTGKNDNLASQGPRAL